MRAEGQTFKCHSAILAGQSRVFRAMLLNDMREKATRQIHLADMEAVTVRAVLTHCYGGRVGPTALPALAAKLLKAGLEKTRVFLKKKPAQWFFIVFFGFLGFFYTFAQKREFLGFLQFQ